MLLLGLLIARKSLHEAENAYLAKCGGVFGCLFAFVGRALTLLL